MAFAVLSRWRRSQAVVRQVSEVGHNGGEPRNARWTAYGRCFCRLVVTRMESRGRRAICLSTAVFQSRTHMEANQRNLNAQWTVDGTRLSRWLLPGPSCRDGGDLSTWVLVLRETAHWQDVGSFPKSDANGGVGGSHSSQAVDSDGRWRHENAAGEAARRTSTLEMIRHWSRRE